MEQSAVDCRMSLDQFNVHLGVDAGRKRCAVVPYFFEVQERAILHDGRNRTSRKAGSTGGQVSKTRNNEAQDTCMEMATEYQVSHDRNEEQRGKIDVRYGSSKL